MMTGQPFIAFVVATNRPVVDDAFAILDSGEGRETYAKLANRLPCHIVACENIADIYFEKADFQPPSYILREKEHQYRYTVGKVEFVTTVGTLIQDYIDAVL